MTQQQLTQLGKIYNTLGLISTKGEDTVIMAECLKALKSLYSEMEFLAKQKKTEENNNSNEEE